MIGKLNYASEKLFWMILKNRRKTPAMDFSFREVACCNLTKERFHHTLYSCEFCEIFQKKNFIELLQANVSVAFRPFWDFTSALKADKNFSHYTSIAQLMKHYRNIWFNKQLEILYKQSFRVALWNSCDEKNVGEFPRVFSIFQSTVSVEHMQMFSPDLEMYS